MSLFHQIIKVSSLPSYKSFQDALQNPIKAQNQTLKGMVSLKEIQASSIQTYSDLEEKILKEMDTSQTRFEPTSGSTSAIKWIPYRDIFRSQLDRAAGPWIFDLYKSFPEITKGKHYWSLSWLPDDLRAEAMNDDADALPWFKSLLLKKVMITDKSLQKLPTSELFLLESLARMLENPVSLISVWSPTFLLRMLELLELEREWLLERLKHHDNLTSFLSSDFQINEDNLEILFPKLRLISAWESGTSRPWADKIKSLFPKVHFQGKGLWATEGVVTFPFEGKYPLAVKSHFYEFLNPVNGNILSLQDLKEGDVVQPLLTTGSGFVRYHLEDNISVTGFLHKTPTFEFLGRAKHIDLAGEKLSFEVAETIMATLKKEFSVEPVCFIAKGLPSGGAYELLVEGTDEARDKALRERAEELLLCHHHYKLARDLGQLKEVEILNKEKPLEYYYNVCKRRIGVDGNIKPEPIIIQELS